MLPGKASSLPCSHLKDTGASPLSSPKSMTLRLMLTWDGSWGASGGPGNSNSCLSQVVGSRPDRPLDAGRARPMTEESRLMTVSMDEPSADGRESIGWTQAYIPQNGSVLLLIFAISSRASF